MQRERPPRTLPLVAAGLCILAFGFAYLGAHRHLRALEWMSGAPHASLAAPIPGPAIYTGALGGPMYTTPLGAPAAAYWWWVVERSGKYSRTRCFLAERSH